VDGSQVLVKDTETVNPFFVGSVGSSVKLLDNQTMYQTYDSVLVLCVKDSVVPSADSMAYLFEYVVKNEDMTLAFEYLTVFRADISMIRNNRHRYLSNVVKGSFLKRYFPNEDFEVTEIVIPLIEMKENMAKMYASLYSSDKDPMRIQNALHVTNHYNARYKAPVKMKLISYIKNMGSSFWVDKKNCNINMTEMFASRGFDYKDVRDDNVREALVANITNNKESPEAIKQKVINVMATEGKEIDYIASAMSTRAKFVDIYDALSSSGKRTYYAKVNDKGLALNNNTMVDLYNSATEDFEKFFILDKFMGMKDYCHLVVNNKKLLEVAAPMINKHKLYFKYVMSYAWMCMYIEECIFKTKSTGDSRFVFDIDTANKLPVFYTCMDDIWQNPYVSMLVDESIVDAPNNCISMYGIADSKHYGICSFQEFERRARIFTTGDSSKDIFMGLNWKYFAISGSIMTACLQRESPLINNIAKQDVSEDNRLLMYFNHYYGKSDIDLMCKTMSVYDFISKACQVYDVIKSNITDYKEGDVEVHPVKSTAVVVTQHFFKERLEDLNDEMGTNYTAEEIVNLIDTRDEDVVEYFYDLYQDVKKNVNKNIRKNSKALKEQYDFNKTILRLYTRKTLPGDINIKFRDNDVIKRDYIHGDGEVCFYINDFRSESEKVPESENYLVYKVSEGIRYKFKSAKLLRCIELFQVRGADYFTVVGRFHFPCVRAYYTGTTVKLLPSCITAHNTGLNTDYKYFAGTNDPVKISNKYLTRGMGHLLNKTELKHMAYYNSEVDEDNGMYHIKDKSKEALRNMFRPKKVTDKIYKPLVYKQGLSTNTYLNPNYDYIENMNDLKKAYEKDIDGKLEDKPIDMFKFRAVTKKGSVAPLQPWLSEAYWSNYNSE
jgi:hypothetical protein